MEIVVLDMGLYEERKIELGQGEPVFLTGKEMTRNCWTKHILDGPTYRVSGEIPSRLLKGPCTQAEGVALSWLLKHPRGWQPSRDRGALERGLEDLICEMCIPAILVLLNAARRDSR